jgi:hypothetical protein
VRRNWGRGLETGFFVVAAAAAAAASCDRSCCWRSGCFLWAGVMMMMVMM